MPSAASLRRGDVVLVPFPFADLTGIKVRPALIVSADPQESELIVAFITSVLTNRSARGAEVELLRSHPDVLGSGLKMDSLIRADKLVTLSRGLISRRHGAIGPESTATLAARLRLAFALD